MSSLDWARVVATVLLVATAAVFAAAEAALSRVSRVQVEEQAREGRRARALAAVVADRQFYIATLLFFESAAQIAAVITIVHVFVDVWGGAWPVFVAAWAVGVVASYVVVGVAARTIGRQHAGGVSRLTAPVTRVLGRVVGPVPRLLILFGNAVTPGKGYRDGPFASEAELLELVDIASERQVIAADERQMIHSVFELGETIVREVMVPRTDMVVIERSKTLRQALSLSLRSGFSRLPVVGASLDDVIGIVHLRDLARRAYDHPKGESVETVERVTRPVSFVPDSKKVDLLLREMQTARSHVAIVVDEYGGTAGLVTIEDILEEIVGEIVDEYDQELPLVQRIDADTVRASVRLPVDDLAELFDVAWPDDVVEDVETVGGLIARVLGRVPIPGARAELEGLVLTAESAFGRRNRIDSVLVHRSRASEPSLAEAAGSAGPAGPSGADGFGPLADDEPVLPTSDRSRSRSAATGPAAAEEPPPEGSPRPARASRDGSPEGAGEAADGSPEPAGEPAGGSPEAADGSPEAARKPTDASPEPTGEPRAGNRPRSRGRQERAHA